MCNVRHLDGAGVNGATAAEEDRHAVMCLSAGSDGSFNTSFDDATVLSAAGGDEVGWTFQGQHQ